MLGPGHHCGAGDIVMKCHYIRASIRRDPVAVRHFAVTGLLDGSAESDHRLAWSVLSGDPSAERDFVFCITSREPFTLEMLSSRTPSVPEGLWDISVREVDLSFAAGTVLNITTTAVLKRSKRPDGPDKRGKAHDLVSAILHDLRSGIPAPEVAHLPLDASRGEVVGPAVLYWFWRASSRLGFEMVQGDNGNPIFAARETGSSNSRGKNHEGHPPSRAIKADGRRAVKINARVRVTDPVAFEAMLRHVVGTAKSYGYGMVRAQVFAAA